MKRLHPRSRAPTRFLCARANLFWRSSDSFSVAVESTSVTNNNILSFLDSAVEVPVERVYRWAACLGHACFSICRVSRPFAERCCTYRSRYLPYASDEPRTRAALHLDLPDHIAVSAVAFPGESV